MSLMEDKDIINDLWLVQPTSLHIVIIMCRIMSWEPRIYIDGLCRWSTTRYPSQRIH